MLFALVAVLLAAVLLRFQGRLWTCSCGEVFVWAGDVWSAHNSQHLFDPYAFTHVLHGIAFFWLLQLVSGRVGPAWRLALAVSAEAAWEVVENSTYVIERYRSVTVSLGYVGDTILNSGGDIVACIAGFAFTHYMGVRRSILVFVFVEVVLAFWIRDGLLLNILMLLWPVDAVLEWQMG